MQVEQIQEIADYFGFLGTLRQKFRRATEHRVVIERCGVLRGFEIMLRLHYEGTDCWSRIVVGDCELAYYRGGFQELVLWEFQRALKDMERSVQNLEQGKRAMECVG